jgi:hypothetical protein
MRALAILVSFIVVTLGPSLALAQPMLVVLDPTTDDPALTEAALDVADVLHEAALACEDYRFVDVDVSLEAALEHVNCTRPTTACLRSAAARLDADALVTGSVITADGVPSVVLRSIVEGEPGRSELMALPLDPERIADWLAFEVYSPPAELDLQEEEVGQRRGWKNPLGVSLLAASTGLLTSALGFGVLINGVNGDEEFQEYRQRVGVGLASMGATTDEIQSTDACEYANAGEAFGGSPELLSHAQSACSQGEVFSVARLVTLTLGLVAGVAGAVTLIAVPDHEDVDVAFDVTPRDARVTARVAF